MRILHVSYSRAGGIGNVVSELVKAQVLDGHQVDWDFLTTGALRSEFLNHPIETLKAGIDDFGLKSPNFQGPISSLRSGRSLMKRVAKKMMHFDVVHIHGGTLDLETITQVETSARIVVSHHDMRLVTGACHQSLGCVGYQSNCPSCPALGSHFNHRAQRQRMGSFPSDWRHTAPSRKFASVIGRSSLLEGTQVVVVPNPLPTELVKYEPSGENNELLTIIGSSTSSPLRSLDTHTLERLSNIALKSNLKLVSIGGNTYDARFVENLGTLNRRQSFEIMSRSKACLTPTKYESFSTVGLEALFLGAFLIAPPDSPQGELAESLMLRIDLDIEHLPLETQGFRKATQAALLEQFEIKAVTKKFNEVYLD